MTAKLIGQSPVLLVRDVTKAIDYWVDKVGFTRGGVWGDPPDFAIIHRDRMHLMLARAPEDHEIVPHWRIRDKTVNAYFWVDDARALFEELKGRGAAIDYELGMQPYGVLEFGIQDLEDHDIAFGQVIRDVD